MSIVMTENVWTFTNGDLLPRSGEITLDGEQPLINESDLLGPIYVESGHRRADTIVFLGFTGLQEELKYTGYQSYLVTHVETHTGGGILVADDLVMRDPRGWINTRVKGMWKALHSLGYSLEDFGVPKLDQHIKNAYTRR